jgi:hypothetical protein
MELVADVKCYYCGHVSGQIKGQRQATLKITAFVPRPGYTKPAPQAGGRLRCERCNGPVYFEDVSPMTLGRIGPSVTRLGRKSKAEAA